MLDPQELNPEALLEWRSHPVTELLLEGFRRQREVCKESWARGVYAAATAEATQRSQIEMLARLDTLEGLVNISVEDIQELWNESREYVGN